MEPLIVYSRAWVDRPLARRKGVRVLPARMLLSFLERRAPTLSADEIDRARRRVLAAEVQPARSRNGSLNGHLGPLSSLRARVAGGATDGCGAEASATPVWSRARNERTTTHDEATRARRAGRHFLQPWSPVRARLS